MFNLIAQKALIESTRKSTGKSSEQWIVWLIYIKKEETERDDVMTVYACFNINDN